MKKIIVFGDLPIATLVAKHIMEDPNVQLIGVVIGNENPTNNDPWEKVPLLAEYVEREGIHKFSLDELVSKFQKNDLYIGFSCRFSKILKKEHIQLFQQGIVNFHGGLLPEFGGLYSSCHTILEGSNLGGGTIHFIDEQIDSGQIIVRAEIEVTDKDTSYTLFQRTQEALIISFYDYYKTIFNKSVKTQKPINYSKKGINSNYYDKNSLLGKKQFYLTDSEEKIDRVIRAFEFPGKEPAFFKLNGKKYFVKTSFNS
ncbi:formyltransferase family protein [Rhodohalobacter barkolensis]|uniref:phosphoribosylglycinamide formyltransferase 1 n=1 Tax=Rhodohalobacter barkolensis TaxID=2053187 RepID=A0A2N0VKD3_9BACT|nr:formyltransferase family protein [Rhodohalobacter barkolensis]PKD44655.1 hypothetical protein CWD77_04110 [Rhodohalobacter barkolensis]